MKTTFATLAAVLSLALAASAGSSPSYKVLLSFNGSTAGGAPRGSLIADGSGNFFGTATAGGASASYGLVYELSPSGSGWTETVLYEFQAGLDGEYPTGGLVLDQSGNLYGVTLLGGGSPNCANGCGTVFELSPTGGGVWSESIIYTFQGGNDSGANGNLIFDSSGNLYGATTGEALFGEVYELSPSLGSWTQTVLHTFSGSDGQNPSSGVAFDAAGNLYGTTPNGGPYANGEVYELQPSASGWTLNIIDSFKAVQNGQAPSGTPVFDANGTLYATTQYGGGPGAHGGVGCTMSGYCGIAFSLTPGPNNTWTESLIHRFGSRSGNAADGQIPIVGMVFDAAGNLWGTTQGGGRYGQGTIYRIAPKGTGWSEAFYSFCARSGCPDGADPEDQVMLDSSGNVYGTASLGGSAGNWGTAFELVP